MTRERTENIRRRSSLDQPKKKFPWVTTAAAWATFFAAPHITPLITDDEGVKFAVQAGAFTAGVLGVLRKRTEALIALFTVPSALLAKHGAVAIFTLGSAAIMAAVSAAGEHIKKHGDGPMHPLEGDGDIEY